MSKALPKANNYKNIILLVKSSKPGSILTLN